MRRTRPRGAEFGPWLATLWEEVRQELLHAEITLPGTTAVN